MTDLTAARAREQEAREDVTMCYTPDSFSEDEFAERLAALVSAVEVRVREEMTPRAEAKVAYFGASPSPARLQGDAQG